MPARASSGPARSHLRCARARERRVYRAFQQVPSIRHFGCFSDTRCLPLMTLADWVRRFDHAEWGPEWLRRMACRARIDQLREFEDHRDRQRLVIRAIVVLAVIGIAAGVASGESVFGAAKAFFSPDGGTVLFVGAII